MLRKVFGGERLKASYGEAIGALLAEGGLWSLKLS